MKRHLFLMTSILALLSLPAGCNKPTDEKPPEKGNVTVTQQGDQVGVEINGPKGGKIKIDVNKPEEATLPDDFPKDVPIPPSTKIKSNAKIGKQTTITFETPAPVSDVVDYYSKSLALNGWKVEKPVKATSGFYIGANKEKRTLSMIIIESDDGTIIKMTL